jgi:head-tail adaptor
MDLKKSTAVCLISLFSATLVLLIARALDLQAASRLEPQLARIVEELEAIRKSGGLTAASASAAEDKPADDCLVVYYFHGNTRCPTCRSIESQSHDTVHTDFASKLDSGEMVWKILNYEEPAAADLTKEFEIQIPMIVLAKMNGGEIEDWRRLDQVWALVGDKPAFKKYVRDEISQMLETWDSQSAVALIANSAETAVAGAEVPEIPIPQALQEPDHLHSQDEDTAVPVDLPEGKPVSDGVLVFYFHATDRCPTCQSIESQAQETVQSEFAPHLNRGEVVWQPLNYEEPPVAALAGRFDVQWPVVVVAKMKGGQIEAWKSLDDVWTLVDDKPAFAQYIRSEIGQMLGSSDTQPAAPPSNDAAEIPIPDTNADDVPVPTAPGDIPVPN